MYLSLLLLQLLWKYFLFNQLLFLRILCYRRLWFRVYHLSDRHLVATSPALPKLLCSVAYVVHISPFLRPCSSFCRSHAVTYGQLSNGKCSRMLTSVNVDETVQIPFFCEVLVGCFWDDVHDLHNCKAAILKVSLCNKHATVDDMIPCSVRDVRGMVCRI